MANPRAWNRYGYVLNNPINANDPSGHKCAGDPEECLDDDGTPTPGFPGGGNNGGGGSCGGPGLPSCGGNGGLSSGGGGPDEEVEGDSVSDYCSAGGTCIETQNHDYPDYWDLNPDHPDYYILNTSGPYIGFTIIIDRYGQVYRYLDFGIITPGASLSAARIGSAVGEPTGNLLLPYQISDFLTGLSVNFDTGVVAGGGVTLSPGTIKYVPVFYNFELKDNDVKPASFYVGAFTPSAGASLSIGGPFKNQTFNWPKNFMRFIIPLLP